MDTGIQRAIAACGSQAALGDALDPPVTQQTVFKWVGRGWAPTHRAKQIQAAARAATGVEIAITDLVKPEVASLMLAHGRTEDQMLKAVE